MTVPKALRVINVSSIESDQGWYGGKWKLVVSLGQGPEATSIRPTDLPEDVRVGLLAWLQAGGVGK